MLGGLVYSLWERFGRKALNTALFRPFASLERQWLDALLRHVPNEMAEGDRVWHVLRPISVMSVNPHPLL
jgi:hypothetical protein